VAGVSITDFLIRDLTLREACDLSCAGSTALVEFVWARGLRAVESERWSVGKMLHTEPRYARWAFTRAMVGAVRRADLAMVQWLRGRFPDCPIYEDVLDEACKCGRLGALQLLHCVGNGNDFRWSSLVTKLAAEFGHWDVVHWLHERHPRLPVSCALAFALKQNNLEEIMWIAAHSAGIAAVGDTYTPYSEETWSARKDCVRYLVARGLAVQGVVEAALPTAGEAGDLRFFQWLMSYQLDRPGYCYMVTLYHSCEHGHIQVVRCLLARMEELGLPSSPSNIMCTAANHGHLALVQWVYEHYGRKAEANLFEGARGLTALEAAAENSHLEVVQFLHGIEAAWRSKRKKRTIATNIRMCSAKGMDVAARGGHLAVVKWLHANRLEGCTTAAMDGAAGNGHLDVVEWLHANRSEGCTSAAMDRVIRRIYHKPGCRRILLSCCVCKIPASFVEEQLTMLEWLKTNRKEGCTSAAIDRASYNGNLTVLQWFYVNTTVRPSSPIPMEAAARAGRLDILKWLHSTYAECRSDKAMSSAMHVAAEHGRLEEVKWLRSKLPGSSQGRALIAAAKYSRFSTMRRQLEVVQFLLPNCEVVDIASAVKSAVQERHFEIMLLLHSHNPTFTSSQLQFIKRPVSVDSSNSNWELSAWVEDIRWAADAISRTQ
jgi:ankyrin repeat protein